MKITAKITAFVVLASLCWTTAAENKGEGKVGSRIQRTMRLLATSTAERRNPVKILFYGQSIVRQDYARKAIEAELRKRYPNADLEVENRAIGGYTAPLLIRTAEQDLYPTYPDLVVFHVYGGEKGGQFEGILRNIRQRTTAEILTWTHHPDARGIEHPGHEAASKLRRELAEKYQCEMVDLREIWKAKLREDGQSPEDFLVDVVHLNKDGGKRMGDILVKAFVYDPNAPAAWEKDIREYPLAEAQKAISTQGDWKAGDAGLVGRDGRLQMKFCGNRVDVTTLPFDGTLGTAKILIDGKAPSKHPDAYAATLPTRSPIDYRPALKLVGLGKDPKVEDWTLTASDVSADGKKFSFKVKGSVTGEDGAGNSEGEFVSNSGRIKLHPREFSFSEAIRIRKKPLPDTFDITWSVYLMGVDTWSPKLPEKAGSRQRTTLIQGIANGEHTLEIIPNGDGPIPIESITVHNPSFDVAE